MEKNLITSESAHTDSDPTLNSSSLDMELPFKRIELGDKEYTKFIKQVERLVRASIEYKEFISFVRESYKANVCALTGETQEETNDVEIHHYPLTLFDICKIVLDSKLEKGEKFSSFDVALEVIKLHFSMSVGIVPLIGTLHKKYHKGFLEIPIQTVIGNYKRIAEIYELEYELLDKIEIAERITSSKYIENKANNNESTNFLESPVDVNLEAKIQAYKRKKEEA